MKRLFVLSAAVIAAGLLYAGPVIAAQEVTFEPVRAPSLGPEDAPVKIIEIVDYM